MLIPNPVCKTGDLKDSRNKELKITSLLNMCWLLLTVADCQKELSLDNILVLTIESMWAVRHLTREESVKMDSGLKPLKHLGAQSSHVFSFFF